jgi:hypothetical protein
MVNQNIAMEMRNLMHVHLESHEWGLKWCLIEKIDTLLKKSFQEL